MLGVENLTMEGGGTVEDLDLDFTLPGYPDIELKVIIMSLTLDHVIHLPAWW